MSSDRTIVLCAGGTGGHMFPALALASTLLRQGYKVVLLTDERGTKFVHSFSDTPHHVISSAPLRSIKELLALGKGVLQSIRILRQINAAAVVGFGGYPSFPGVLAAAILRKPIILHEQNAVLGKANAFLGRFATYLALSMPPSSLHPLPISMEKKSHLTGNPVREDIAALAQRPYVPAKHDSLFNLFVVGGSLGAAVFAEVLPKAIAKLPTSIRQRLCITQQARQQDIDALGEAYTELDVHSFTVSRFFDDVADRLLNAHMVICRAGASTVAEISASGRPALFVPYPHHGDAQQSRNAESLVDIGGAIMMEESGFTPESLASRLEPFIQNPEILSVIAEKAQQQAKLDASEQLAKLVTSTLH